MFTLTNVFEGINDARVKFQPGPIGIEFSCEKVHMVQLEKSATGDMRLRALATMQYESGRDEFLASHQELKRMIKSARKAGPFSGNKIVTTMQAGDLRMLPVSYGAVNGKHHAPQILKLLQSRIEENISDYVIDYIPIRSNANADECVALVAMAKHDKVISYLETIRRAGLEVEAIDISPAAINRMISATHGHEYNDNVLVINFGLNSCFMTLLSGRRLLLDQELAFGQAEIIAQTSQSLDITDSAALELINTYGLSGTDSQSISSSGLMASDITQTLEEVIKPKFMQLVSEINRALIYAAAETRGEPVKQVYILGSVARWSGADVLLKKLTKIEVCFPSFEKLFGYPDGAGKATAPEIAVATGLALRGMINND